MNLNGFFILQLPSTDARSVYRGYYGLRWEKLDVDYWDKTLPQDIGDLYSRLKDNWSKYGCLELSKDITTTQKLLEYSNRGVEQSEILGIICPLFDEADVVIDDKKMSFRGYDVVGEHGGARIDLGVLFKPYLFSRFVNEINEHGLFNSKSVCLDYIAYYRNIVAETQGHQIEDCGAEEGDIIEIAEIYSIKQV